MRCRFCSNNGAVNGPEDRRKPDRAVGLVSPPSNSDGIASGVRPVDPSGREWFPGLRMGSLTNRDAWVLDCSPMIKHARESGSREYHEPISVLWKPPLICSWSEAVAVNPAHL